MQKERLLCENCERQISGYERTVREVLFGNAPAQNVRKGRIGVVDPNVAANWNPYTKGEIRLVATGDYHATKLFQLSLLWRSAVASDDFYRLCRLDRESLVELEGALRDGVAPSPEIFPCQVLDLHKPGTDLTKSIDTPRRITSGKEVISFIIAGYGWHFWLRPKPAPSVVLRKCLRADGVLPIQRVDATPVFQWWSRNGTRRNGEL